MTRVPGAMTSLYNYKLFNEIQLSLNSNSLWMWNWPPVVLNRISFNKPARGSLDICSLDGWNIPYDYKQKGLSIPCCLEFKVQWPHFTGWSTKHILCANVNFAPSFWIVCNCNEPARVAGKLANAIFASEIEKRQQVVRFSSLKKPRNHCTRNKICCKRRANQRSQLCYIKTLKTIS